MELFVGQVKQEQNFNASIYFNNRIAVLFSHVKFIYFFHFFLFVFSSFFFLSVVVVDSLKQCYKIHIGKSRGLAVHFSRNLLSSSYPNRYNGDILRPVFSGIILNWA